jgi:hypothetical protein
MMGPLVVQGMQCWSLNGGRGIRTPSPFGRRFSSSRQHFAIRCASLHPALKRAMISQDLALRGCAWLALGWPRIRPGLARCFLGDFR